MLYYPLRPSGFSCGAILLCDLRPRGLAEADVWPALDFQAIRLAFARRCLGATFAVARSLDNRPRGLAEADAWPALDFQAIRLAFARRCLGATFAAARSL